ncbi:uncharacterized protein LOC119590393 [Penaeus monodon]|uniref:uncharacterized protein LOC119590393 n=1 Tax=Penaeus monodon TaxID=6687 RepID=UPI0018A7AB89|nr:uncharacterized protein LOC119590393 [Penaeus monodon]
MIIITHLACRQIPKMMKQALIVGVVLLGLASSSWAETVHSTDNALYEGALELARTSTVYSFNFKNLVVYMIIAFVLMVGLTGIRTGLGFIGRSAEESFFDKSDLLYLTTYLVSDGIERYDCLNRLACLDDRKAERLLTTSKMMINGAKYLQPVFGYSLEKYETISDGVFDAIMFRQEGGSCDSRYTCPAMPSL